MSTSPAERQPAVFDLQPDRSPMYDVESGSQPVHDQPRGAHDVGDTDDNETTAPDGPTEDRADGASPLQTPGDYLAELCGLHQVVLLGDQTGVSQHVKVVADTIAPLYEAGVRNLAWEYTNSRAQADLDRVVTSPEWDERGCAALFVDLLGVGFAYREYADVVRAAWEVNAHRPPDSDPFRIIAMGVPTYVEDPDLLDGRSAGELELRNWWMGGHHRDLTAFHMANVLTSEVLRHGGRVLVYCDVTRTPTRLVQWIDGLATTTLGNLLHRWMGEGVQRVLFHGAIDDPAAIERVEALIEAAPEDVESLGIDLELSTLGNVGVTEIVGSIGGTQTTFRLRDLADGYLYTAPRHDWEPCELIEDLITPQNYVDVEARYRALDPRDEHYSLEELEEVRQEGQELLENAWPELPEPEVEEQKRGRFRRR